MLTSDDLLLHLFFSEMNSGDKSYQGGTPWSYQQVRKIWGLDIVSQNVP